MKIDTYQCDSCGQQKQLANHWWLARRRTQHDKVVGVEILEWGDKHADEFSHLCGAACVSKWVSENLLTQ